MKTDIDTRKIKELLNDSTSQFSPETLDKLRMARTRALDHQRVRHSVPVLAWLGHHEGSNDSFHLSRGLNLALAAIFVVCLVSGFSVWHTYKTEHEICDVDIAILTDDMPINVFLD